VIIDCHCHAGKGDLLTAPWNTAADLGPYLRRARAAGIDKTIVFPAFHTDNLKANLELARMAARNRGRLICFAFVHAIRDAGRIYPMLKRAVMRWGFRGMKVHGMEAMPTREVCETARRLRIPILVDVAGRTHVAEMFATEYPDVDFIVPHLGSFAGDWKAHQQTIDQLVRHPNLYADTSSVRHYDYIVQAVKRAGPRKILFGSDGPWLHPGVEIQKIRLLGLPVEQENLVLGGNILRLMARRETRNGKQRKVAKPSPLHDALERTTFARAGQAW
jgi:predicted TIM-barrel fold metal-dependent hydrolase